MNNVIPIKQCEIKLKLLPPEEDKEITKENIVYFYKNLINIFEEKN